MDEYYCPNCGAVLNEQDGFDPDDGVWCCTECGEQLMDDDVYYGDHFEGIAWYCDECGAFLNRQKDFSDSYGTWRCTECGYVNGTTEDDIDGAICCPACGALLNTQYMFEDYLSEWQCTNCDAVLHRDYQWDEFSVVDEVENPCPNCGADLDEQIGYFSYEEDWICSECGAHLHREYYDDPYDVIEDEACSTDRTYRSSDTHGYKSNGKQYTNTARDGYYSSNTYSHDYKRNAYSGNTNTWYDNINLRIYRKTVLFGVMIVALLVFNTFVLYETGLKIPVGYSSSELIGLRYEDAINRMKIAGFSAIHENEIDDLSIEQLKQEYYVTSIRIGIANYFSKGSCYPSNFPVTVTYHSLKRFNTPVSSKEAKGAPYLYVKNSFIKAGFSNVVLEADYDIVAGWLYDIGEVESVSINGVKSFAKGSSYRADAEIIITYHDLKKNRPR